MNNSIIPRNTPVYLVALHERVELIGRVATVIDGPMSADDADGDDWYKLSSAWIGEEFKGCEAQTRRGNLRPIIPPPLTEEGETQCSQPFPVTSP
jgi:hypothetical protein